MTELPFMYFLYYQSICKIIIGPDSGKPERCAVFLLFNRIYKDATDIIILYLFIFFIYYYIGAQSQKGA